MAAILELDSVEVHRGLKRILGPISMRIEEGERWVVLGPNGAGKTTLLKLCAALIHPTRGQVRVLGEQLGAVDVFELRNRIGLTSSALLEHIPEDERVIDIVITAAYAIHGRWIEEYDLWDESRASALLKFTGIRDISAQTFGSLSEGEKKRTMIARALMTDPELLLLDEPAAGLDLAGREDILRRITQILDSPGSPASVIVTHHIEEIPSGTTHALLLKAGEVHASGPISSALTSQTLSSLYGIDIALSFETGRYFAVAR